MKTTRKLNSSHPSPGARIDGTAPAIGAEPRKVHAPRKSVRERKTRVLAVTSGKGGVGKTNVVANMAVTLSDMGKKVVVLDADFGLANLDVLLGLTPRYHLGHVLFGNKTLAEIMVQGPKGIQIIPASSGLQRLADLTVAQRNFLVESFAELDADTDYFIIDTAAGISSNVLHFLLAAHEVIVVSAPEPTAIVDAYALIKILLGEQQDKLIRVLINSTQSEEEAREVFRQINSVVRRFLDREVLYLGHVERDPHVLQAIKSQVLVTHYYPSAPASRSFRRITRSLLADGASPAAEDGLVWERFLNDWIN